MEKIKLGIDFHGVITDRPDFFADFTRLAIEKGCEIYILSGGRKQDIETYLHIHHIQYSYIWSMVDDFSRQNLVEFFQDGSFRVEDDLWDKAKAVFCAEHHIRLHIDDSLLYGRYFITPFGLYDKRQRVCLTDQTCLDMNQPPENFLQDILNLLSKA